MKLFFTLICLFLSQTLLQANYPIYLLLTHPRATGTAFEKIMSTQKGIAILHGPFLEPYLTNKYPPDHPFVRSLKNPTVTYDDVKDRLFKLAKKSPVFFKESGYVLIDYLKNNPDFCQNPQVKIAFLTRDPAKSVLSFYKKMPSVPVESIGHKALWEIFEMLDPKPLVIDSDELLKNPLPLLNELGKSWELTFEEKNLSWESGYSDEWLLFYKA